MDLDARLTAIGIVPIVALADPVDAPPVGDALMAAGLPCIEITFRTGAAAEAIARTREQVPDLLVAAGTVLTLPDRVLVGCVPRGIEVQTHQVLRNIRSILAADGSSMDDVVKVTAHLADLADFEAFNRVCGDYCRPPYPVRTTVGSQLLGILVEIDAIAAPTAERPPAGAGDGGPR